ncbi:MAG: YceI family protein [Nocardioides sp.]|uniref:YceI family protein n=1 Tax=Nocardioides sp. TaxID=35761 RepID=UPI0039E6956C
MTDTTSPVGAAELIARLRADGAGEWVLDAARSRVELKSRSMWGMVPVSGTFTEVAGHGSVSASGAVTGTLSIATASIDTAQRKRDEHLRSADFFDAETHPFITYDLTALSEVDGDVIAEGQLTVRGVTRPLSVAVAPSASSEVVQLTAEATIDRSAYGLSWNKVGMASMSNLITVTAVFHRHT